MQKRLKVLKKWMIFFEQYKSSKLTQVKNILRNKIIPCPPQRKNYQMYHSDPHWETWAADFMDQPLHMNNQRVNLCNKIASEPRHRGTTGKCPLCGSIAWGLWGPSLTRWTNPSAGVVLEPLKNWGHTQCYPWSECLCPPKLICGTQSPRGWIRRWGRGCWLGHEGGAPRSGICALMNETHPFFLVRTRWDAL